jgi:exodeoxyribonuclease-3
MPAVEQWVAEVQPDVLCMQETKLADEAFPAAFFADLGYESAHHGNGAWNGVAICSRVGLGHVVRGFAGDGPESECRSIRALCGDVTVVCVYVPNGRVVGSVHYAAKLDWLHELVPFVSVARRESDSVVVCGDFNVAPTDLDVYEPSAFVGETHVTAEEREALGQLLDLGFVDVLRAVYPSTPGLFSWWDYRRGDFHSGRGMRIDLVLATEGLARRTVWALIDRNARKGQGSKTAPQPSDHAPVTIELADSR